ncbi:MAG: RbsD/FucU domain-containing protein [Terracidiphilus sp.]
MSNIAPNTPLNWEERLQTLLPLYGHRNWIVVADAAYPAQSSAGIETIVAEAEQVDVVRAVAEAIAAAKHIRANVYLDREIDFVSNSDARGIDDYRQKLDAALFGSQPCKLPHEQIIAKLDQAGKAFRILIIKTALAIPYTSVFFELDCGYWNVEAEQRLRQALAAAEQK